MNQVDLKDLNINAFGQVHHEYIGYQSLTDVPKVLAYSEAEYDFSHFMKESTVAIIKTLHSIEGLQGQAYLLGVLQGRHNANFVIDNKTSINLIIVPFHRSLYLKRLCYFYQLVE